MTRLGQNKLLVRSAYVAIGLLIAACSSPGYTAVDAGPLKFKHAESPEYCAERLEDYGFIQYCVQGKTTIEFVDHSPDVSLANVFSQTISALPVEEYVVVTLEGSRKSTILLAEVTSVDFVDPFDEPRYVAIIPFSDRQYVIARGYAYDLRLEDEFRVLFRGLIRSLEPYTADPSGP